MGSLQRLTRHIYSVPWCVPQWGWRELGASLAGAVSRSNRDATALGPTVAAALGKRYAISTARGRVAIELGLRAVGIAPDDDVVLPSYVCKSVLLAVQQSGGRPVFADVGPSLNVTLEDVERALTPRTRAVIVPHLFGMPAPVDAIASTLLARGIALIDDAAQALGAVLPSDQSGPSARWRRLRGARQTFERSCRSSARDRRRRTVPARDHAGADAAVGRRKAAGCWILGVETVSACDATHPDPA